MRESKFRGKRVDNGSWIYGSLNRWDNRACIVPVGCSFSKTRGDSNEHVVSAYIIETETTGEYAGLKDKNGVEIYEGDKLAVYTNKAMPNVRVCRRETVSFRDGCFVMSEEGRHYMNVGIFGKNQDIEVVGNVHEEKA